MLILIFSQIYKLANEREVYKDEELQTIAFTQSDISKIFNVVDKISITNDIMNKKTTFGNISLDYSGSLIKVYYKGKFTGCAFEKNNDFNAVYYSYEDAEIIVINNAVFVYNGRNFACFNLLEYKGRKPIISIGIAEHSIRLDGSKENWTKLPHFVVYLTDKNDYSEGYRYLFPIGIPDIKLEKRYITKYKLKK
ncbi:MAG: hypothetical protein ABIL37_00775 [candidate division WOR-3 bacterium]